MPEIHPLRTFLSELRRRRVFSAAAVYLAVGFVLLQVADIVIPALRLPEWVLTFVVVLLGLGFPVALVLAWAFELTPRGMERTRPADDPGPEGEPHPTPGTRRVRAVAGAALAVAALAGLTLALAFAWRWSGREGASPTLDSDVVAVLPFSVSGGEHAFLGEGMVNLLSTSLDGAGELRSVDPRALLSLVGREGWSGGPDPRQGREVALRFGAGLYVLGDIVEVGERLTLRASLYESAAPGSPIGTASAEGRAEAVFELVDEVAAGLLGSLGHGPAARVTRLAAVTTPSLAALKAYLEGEAALRGFRFEPAFEAFGRAIAIDSQFALAYYRRSVAAEWLTRAEDARLAAEAALEKADRLAERDRRLLEAFRAFRFGRVAEAEERYRSLVGAYPDDVEAWTYLGELLFHTNSGRGRSPGESREPFERVLSLEPDHVPALVHLARVSTREKRAAEIDSLVGRILELSPAGDRELEMRALQLSATGTTERGTLLAMLPGASELAVVLAVWDVGAFANDLEGTEPLARHLAGPARSAEARVFGHAVLGHVGVGRGRWAEAKRELERARAVEPVAGLEHLAFLATIPFVPAGSEELAAIRSAVESLDPAGAPDSESHSVFFNVHDGLHAAIREYLLGRLSARLGDTAAAVHHADRLASFGTGDGSFATDLALGIRAEVADRGGRPEEALRTLERIRDEVWYEYKLGSPYFAQVAERFHRAELLARLGRDREALGWFANLVATSLYEVAYIPMAHLHQARLHERLGEREQAIEHYRRFVELWRDCDPELRPVVQEAEARLAGLSR